MKLVVHLQERRHLRDCTCAWRAGPGWPALVATRMPLVIYMGVARCEELQSQLLAGGLDPTTPAAIVSNATREDERCVTTTVATLAATLRAAAIRSPAVMIVGEVARAAQLLRAPVVIEDHGGLEVGRIPA